MAARSGAGKLTQLSRREREIMDILFQRGQATVGEVVAALADPPSYSAVRATLNILVTKKLAQFREDGPRYVYLPTIPAESARAAAIRHMINTFFGGSAEDAAVALLQMSDTALTQDAVERLAREVQKAKKEGR